MADEPPAKKSRTTEYKEESPEEEREVIVIKDERSITLDLSNYPDWVRSLPDVELERVFAIGVLVRDSLRMTVDSNQEHLEKVLAAQLDSQMKPVKETVGSIEVKVSKNVQDIERKVTKSVIENILNMTNVVNQFKESVSAQLTNIQTNLVTNVSRVADKVKPLDSLNTKIDQSKEKILEEVWKLNQSVRDLGKPKAKGLMGELHVLSILNAGLPGFTVQHSASFGNSGDVLVTSPEGEEFPIEVKNHENPVAKHEIEKFEKVVVDSPTAKVGIMLSLRSGISRRSTRRKFEIYSDKNKYFIYVPKALEDQNLMVWSVMLANELAQMNAELKDSKKSKLSSLYESFNNSIDNAKRSRRNLESLEATVKNLKEDMVPILDIVEKSKTEIYKLLH